MSRAEAEAAGMRRGGGHAILFPFPASGHIAPFVPFARSLASRGVAVTFLYPEHELSRVRSLVDDPAFAARENVELVSYEAPDTHGGLNLVGFEDVKTFMYANAAMFDAIVGRIVGEARAVKHPVVCDAGPPGCIVSDMFLGFTQATAKKFNMQRYCLFTSPIHFLSFLCHLPKFHSTDAIPIKPDTATPFHIPNFPPIPPFDLPPSQHANMGQPDSHLFLLNEAERLLEGAGVLVNSVRELEEGVAAGLEQYLQELFPTAKAPVLKIFTVGPLCEGAGHRAPNSRPQSPTEPSPSPLAWLDQQPPSSVLYICFGTVAMLSADQITQIAIALERTRQRFFWVLRVPKEHAHSPAQLFPEGFLARTSAQGVVHFRWAPQPEILAHPATKAFVTHCGWNSVVEAVVAGVPMVAWPYQADQMMNSTFLESLGVGVRINDRGGVFGGEVASARIARAVTMVMAEREGEDMKRRMEGVRAVVERAVGVGGSSWQSLETFVEDVRALGLHRGS